VEERKTFWGPDCDRTRGNGFKMKEVDFISFKMKEGRFRPDIRKKFFLQ